MPGGPAYDISLLIAACVAEKDVVILGKAEDHARQHFKLQTKIEVVRFIGNGGLEKRKFINSLPYENRPGLMADAWEFYSGETPGYLAFAFSTLTGKWLVKSFTRNTNPTQIVNLPFAGLTHLLKKP